MILSRLSTPAEMRLMLITHPCRLIKIGQEMLATPPVVVQVSNRKQ